MREIKFRAFDGKRMLFMGLGGFCDFELCGGELFEWDSTGFEIHEKDYPLMQYTGLKDKNGVEIYEGDIVSPVTINNSIGAAVIKYNLAGFIAQHQFGEILDCDAGYMGFDIEVIGNIHQNPELIE